MCVIIGKITGSMNMDSHTTNNKKRFIDNNFKMKIQNINRYKKLGEEDRCLKMDFNWV